LIVAHDATAFRPRRDVVVVARVRVRAAARPVARVDFGLALALAAGFGLRL
jgi:hypothetical protein